MSLYSHYDLDDDIERAHDRLDDEIAALSERAAKAEAEADRLRDLVEEFLEEHPSGEHWQATIMLAEGCLAGWCGECMAEWPCLVDRARSALDAEEGNEHE